MCVRACACVCVYVYVCVREYVHVFDHLSEDKLSVTT